MASILVLIEKGEHSCGAYAPDVPGCIAVGEMREEVERLIKEALREHLQMMREEHLPLPRPEAEAEADGHSAFSINSFVLAMHHILSQKVSSHPRLSPMRSVFPRLLPRISQTAGRP